MPLKYSVSFYNTPGVCGDISISHEKHSCPLTPEHWCSTVYLTHGTRMFRDQALLVRAVRASVFFQPLKQ